MCLCWVLFPLARDCFEAWKKLTILEILCVCVCVCVCARTYVRACVCTCVCVSVRVCVSSLSVLRGWCVMSFHPAMATGSRERLHSSRSGAHHWEDEKLPTEPRLPSLKKPPWAHTSHFCLPSQRKGRGGGVSVRCVPQHPNALGCSSLQHRDRRNRGVYYLMSLCYSWSCPHSVTCCTCVCVSVKWMQVVDYSSGLSAFNCIWKEHSIWRCWPTF